MSKLEKFGVYIIFSFIIAKIEQDAFCLIALSYTCNLQSSVKWKLSTFYLES